MANIDLEEIFTHLIELEKLIFGKALGNGCYRNVFEYKLDENKVIKVANCEAGRQENIFEYKLW